MRIKPFRQSTLIAAGAGLAVFALAWLSMYVSLASGNGSVFVWLPDALAFAVLISHSRRFWRKMILAMMLGIFGANLLIGYSVLFSGGLSFANAVEFVSGAFLVKRYVPISSSKLSLATALRILGLYGGIAIPAGMILGGTFIAVNRGLPLIDTWRLWYLGDLSGAALLLLPMLMLLHKQLRYTLYSGKNFVFWGAALLIIPSAWFSLKFTHFPLINITVLLSFIAFVVGGLRIAIICNFVIAVIGGLLLSGIIEAPSLIQSIGLRGTWATTTFACLFASMVGIIADELREKNLLLTASEARFYDAMEFAASGFALGDINGRILEVNGAFCRMLGYTREELRGSFATEITHHEDRATTASNLQKLKQGEIDFYRVEKRYLHKDGHVVWTDVKVSLLNSADGSRKVIVQVEDVTERRLQQQEILRLSERLSLATAAGGIGVWDLDLKTHALVWDEQMYRIYDLGPGMGSNTYEMWRQCVYPEDLASTEVLLNKAIYESKPFNAEFRIYDSARRIRHIRAAGNLILDEKKQPGRMVGVNMDITMIKDAEKLQEKARSELQTIIDHMPAMIGYWDTELRNRFGNQNYLEWFGRSPYEMQGRHIREIIGDDLYQLNLPYIHAALRGEPQQFERTLMDVSGNTRYSLASYLPDIEGGEVKGFYVFVADITQLKHAQNAVAEAQAHLQGVIDGASEFAIIATDLDGTIRLFNKGAEHMLGYSAEELVGKAKPDILHVPEEVIERRAALSQQAGYMVAVDEVFIGRARRGESEASEWTLVHKDGRHISVRLVVAPVRNHEGEITGFVGIANDISEQRQARQALRRAKELAEQASQAKSDFVANMSHEIRTPMNAILGMSYVLDNTPLTTEQRQHLDMIRSSAQSLLGILDEILDFSKIEAGKMELAPVDFDLKELLGTILGMLDVSASQKGLELILGMDDDVPAFLHGDAKRLRQVLINLAGNAVKFTDQGKVEIRVSVVQREAQLVFLRFCINDTGIGMEPERVSCLFRPFEQGDTSITRRFGGTGLGLAISRRLVEMMGGAIDARSTLGEGSEFSFEVPLDALPEGTVLPEAQLASRATAVVSQPPRLTGAKLLLAEDNRINQEVAQRILVMAGAELDIVSDGQQAVDRLRDGNRYDAVLMDIQMPVMDGYRATSMIRGELKLNIPVIAMTAGVTQTEQEQCMKAGMNAVIAKPVDPQALMLTIQRYLPVQSESTIAGFDAAGVLEMLDGDVPFFCSLVRQFIDSTKQNLETIQQVLAEGKRDEALRLLHMLKGTAGTLRVQHLATAAEKAESSLRNGGIPSVADVDLAFQKAKSAMTAFLASMEPEAEENC